MNKIAAQPTASAPQDSDAQAWIGLGGNLGDAIATLEHAAHALAHLPDTRLEAASPLYRSAPVDAQGPDFINAVVRLRTRLAPLPLLRALLALELDAGRQRPWRNAPRTLDLDLLRYERAGAALTCDSEELTLPHPRMQQRAFVLRPLADIDPTLAPATALAAVADQALERLPQAQQWAWSGQPPKGCI